MIIHTVKNGENLYNIARRYSVPPTKILGDNDLYGDRLIAGDELLILIPTRTETVRGKDTLKSMAEKFKVRKDNLLCLNPALGGKDKLRPGQVITVKQDMPSLGAGSVLGQIHKGCRRESLFMFLPYTTYITINAGVIENNEIKITFDPAWASDICKAERKIHLFGIKDNSKGKFLDSKENYESIIENMVKYARQMNYNGIFISAKEASENYKDAFCEFLFEARKRFIGCDLLLFSEIFQNTPRDASEISDGAVLNICGKSLRSSEDELRSFSKEAESSKVFVNLPSPISSNDTEISVKEAKELCYRSGLNLSTDKETFLTSFTYTRYRVGEGEKINIKFPSLSYIKGLYERLSERGFIGIALNTDNSPISSAAMFTASFARADYSLPYRI